MNTNDDDGARELEKPGKFTVVVLYTFSMA